MSPATSTPRTFVLASRASELARIQTNSVIGTLQSHFTDPDDPRFTASFMSTAGDKNQSQALYLLGGKALWTKELEVGLKEKDVDLLVYCLKDVPTTLPEGCVLGAVLEREHAVDSLVVKSGAPWKTLDELPEGSVVGTSSVRRVAQLKRRYPLLKFVDVDTFSNTRLAKLDAPEGPLVLAKAGLVRMGWEDRVTADLLPPTMFYAVSRGALGIEIRSDDEEAIEPCTRHTHCETLFKCLAERACLRVLEGGCSVPVGVFAELDSDVLKLTGRVTSLNGDEHVKHTIERIVVSREDAEVVGQKLAYVLIEKGARKILDDISLERDRGIERAQAQDEVL